MRYSIIMLHKVSISMQILNVRKDQIKKTPNQAGAEGKRRRKQ